MAYINISNAIYEPMNNYVLENWINSEDFRYRNIYSRFANLALVPCSFLTSTADAMVGSVSGLGTVLTGGIYPNNRNFTFNHLGSGKTILTDVYKNILWAVNPRANFPAGNSKVHPIFFARGIVKKPPIVGYEGNGFLTGFVITALRGIASTCYSSDNLLKRHVVSRLTYALLAMSCGVTRAVDGVIGVVAATFSILSAGRYGSLNNLAYRALQTPGIIEDLVYCSMKIVNPWAGVHSK